MILTTKKNPAEKGALCVPETEPVMAKYDIAVIGTGPAGVSAAITAKVRSKNIILFGPRNLSEKFDRAETIRNYPGFPDVPGPDLAKAFQTHLDALDIPVVEKRVSMIYPYDDRFMIQAGADVEEADAVILATGVSPAFSYPGETELLGRGVSYCATCDAALYRGKKCFVIASRPEDEAEAEFLAEYAAEVTFVPLYPGEPKLNPGIRVLREKPMEIRGGMKVETLVTDAGEYPADGVFILRPGIAPDRLLPGLALENGHIAVDRSMATNVPGCYAAGDVTGTPYQYVKSAGEGNVAALSAVRFLDEKARTAR